jgi:hypothetical protein
VVTSLKQKGEMCISSDGEGEQGRIREESRGNQ